MTDTATATAERHVLFAALRAHKQGLPGRTREALRDSAVSRAFLEDPPIDSDTAISSLLAAGLLEEDAATGLLRIATHEIDATSRLQAEESTREFDARLTAAERSPTYLRFRERVYGIRLAQFGLIDRRASWRCRTRAARGGVGVGILVVAATPASPCRPSVTPGLR